MKFTERIQSGSLLKVMVRYHTKSNVKLNLIKRMRIFERKMLKHHGLEEKTKTRQKLLIFPISLSIRPIYPHIVEMKRNLKPTFA